MTGHHGLGLSRAEILRRIQDVFQAFLEDLMNDTFTTFHTLKRATSAMTFDCDALTLSHGGEKRAIKMTSASARKYTGMWLVLQIAHQLLLEDKTVTQRELYYLHPFFTSQQEADECILDVSGLLCVPRECLNIIGGVKGYFTGRLCYRSADKQWIDCSLNGASGQPISRELLRLESEDMTSDAQYIIVVEKEGIFNRLGEDLFYNRVPCILVTGKGFPDLATRIFVKKLRDTLRIPVLGLCDCNPFGLSILLSFKFGSARMPLDSVAYAVDMHWVGLRPLDTALLELPDVVHTKFSKHDTRRLQSLTAHPFVQMDAAYRAEVQHWTKHPLKIELEALHTKGFGFITEYLEAQVLARNYI
ncbi:hypothetical protein SDRG_03242 [Saprolegnia diclina VS20]|uniref:DNA topoisomerase (ATP-hydrolyzing) n=1 Tax=Saprolegnia diclina (strain VS20) TaxID=1156394 RepID=T0SAI3_SAPDV|nr:hypothetical protein SDRG_03242 [Saprolegnia diclina VS20]EQC39822.1 hypothetical protein SDRG_03242 [Saprolegnia diclina VS20]|eukprot:XP_008607094.1 hypothetical protein SDRG_03242 [Saprolegnia diclina VS20]